jgi:hypothetical protein
MAANETTISTKPVSAVGDDSSESDGETEPAKSFHRRFSTNKNIKSSVNMPILISQMSHLFLSVLSTITGNTRIEAHPSS